MCVHLGAPFFLASPFPVEGHKEASWPLSPTPTPSVQGGGRGLLPRRGVGGWGRRPDCPGLALLSQLRVPGLEATWSSPPLNTGGGGSPVQRSCAAFSISHPFLLLDTAFAIGVSSSEKPLHLHRSRTQAGRKAQQLCFCTRSDAPSPANHAWQVTADSVTLATPGADSGRVLCQVDGATMLFHFKPPESPQGPLL